MGLSTPIVEKRKLLTSGTSIMVAVPRQWLEEQGLEKGDEVLMIANGELRFLKANEENITKIRNQLSPQSQSSPGASDCPQNDAAEKNEG